MPVYLLVWVWGKITEERTAQKVLKFKILWSTLAQEGGAVCGTLREYLFQQ